MSVWKAAWRRCASGVGWLWRAEGGEEQGERHEGKKMRRGGWGRKPAGVRSFGEEMGEVRKACPHHPPLLLATWHHCSLEKIGLSGEQLRILSGKGRCDLTVCKEAAKPQRCHGDHCLQPRGEDRALESQWRGRAAARCLTPASFW